MTLYLIGDSVRLGYEPHVRAALPEQTIVSPPENCQSSREVAQNIAAWTAGAGKGDTVHLNCGLHDIRIDANKTRPITDPAAYRRNLVQIFDHLKQTGANVIWANSTPFLEGVHNLVKPSRRYLADLHGRNLAAEALAAEYGFSVNDLYSLMYKQDLTALMVYDGLHFNEAGSRILGEAVVEAVKKQVKS
ncbi:SGNH/GDSL hydrolase family protein [Neisseria chenwenguii]|uniref:Lipase n=1 Tax=Neisseria chenwenguii TaxID=1853278 RepID=A0A220RZA6_9NEIS|nr:SGNH/GDSL hydrolase family protein [Neisseria chenwenguii]ASK26478.1 lipase [Neisseria chenwenguii]ROV55920.1 SGNH/GDSL hydrolase family protein [Neisseria chenwenguii]